MDEQYKVSLGVDVDVSDLQSQINKADVKPVQIKVEIENLNEIKQQLQNLGGTKGNKKVAIPIDTASIENALHEVSTSIKEIRSSIGTLDSKSGMKSLLSSINQISSALDKASDKFESLNANLNALSGKDLSLNFGINLGGSNPIARQSAYGNKARNDTLPQLKQQMNALVKYYNDAYKDTADEFSALQKLVSGTKLSTGDFFQNFMFGKDSVASRMSSGSLSSQMQAYKQYIDMFKQAANLKGLDLNSVTSQFSKSADQLIQDAQDIQTGAKEMDESFEKLKQIFGGGNNLNVEGLSAQLDSIVKDLGEIKIALQDLSSGTSLDGLTRSFDRLSETIEKLVQNCTTAKKAINDSVGNVRKSIGQGSGETTIKETSNELKKLKDLARQIGQLDFKIVKSDYKNEVNQIREFERQLELLKTQYNATLNSLNGKDIDIGSEVTKEFVEARNKMAEFEAKIADTKAEMSKKLELRLETGDFTTQIQRVENDAAKLSKTSDRVESGIKEVNQALNDMRTAAINGDIDGLINANERYEASLKDVKNQLEQIKIAEQNADNKASLTTAKENALLRLKNLFGDNSEAARKFGSEVDRLQKEINECGNLSGIKNLNQQITNLGLKVKESNAQTQTFGQRLKKQWQQYSSYLSVASLFMYAEQGLRSMFEQVKAIDSAMTELKKVTNETDATYNKFLSNAADRAKEIGTTIDGLVSSTADFARLGYGFEDAQGLAEVANVYAVVGDEIEGVEGATESLISTMAAFKNEMNDMSNSEFAMSIIDKFNEIGNNFAISSGGIGEALERSASSLMAANNTIDESIALITAANTVVQDPTTVGTAFKTISMRIRGAKTELEEAGLETEGMVESTATLRSEILALSGVDIMKNANEFKSTYAILDELAVKWQDLSDIQQATVTELIAGKRQGNIVSSLMANFDTARDALETSLNSAGSAMEEHEKWQQSLEAQINNLKAAWQGLSQAFLNSSFLKNGINLLTKLLSVVEKLVKTFGTLGTIGLGTGLYNLFKTKGLFSSLATFGKWVANIATSTDTLGAKLKNLGTAAKTTGKDIGSGMSTLSKAGTIIGLVVSVIGLAVNAYKNYREEISAARQETIETSDKFLESASSFEKAYIKYSGKTNLTVEEEKELESAINGTVEALGDKSSALQNAVNSSSDYVSALERITRAELNAANAAAKEKRDSAKLELQDTVTGLTKLDGNEVDIVLKMGTMDDSLDQTDKALKIAKEVGAEYYNKTEYGYRIDQYKYGFALPVNADINQIVNYYHMLEEYQDRLSDEDLIDTDIYDKVTTTIEKMSEAVATYESGVYEAAKAQYQLFNGIPKTTEEYLAMRESILRSDDIKDLSLDAKNIIANSLDSEYKSIFDLSSAEVQAKKFIGLIKGYGNGTKDGTNEIGTVETFLNMRTAVNNNECSVGEYLAQFDEIDKMTANWSDDEKELLNTSLGLDTDTIKQQYKDLSDYLSRLYTNKDIRNMNRDEAYDYKFKAKENDKKIAEFLNSLTVDELAAVIDIRTEIDWENTSAEDIRKQIEDRVKLNEALNFNASIEVDKTALEALNTALTESASAMGLSEESIDSLKAKYSDLEGYNPHTLFERTANGVKVNREELAKLEQKYNDLTKTEVQEHLDTLVEEYNKCTKAIDGNIGSQEKLELISKREKYAQQIEELAEYQAQLEGVTGAYQRWIDAQNTPEDYEGYQAVATSREDIEDEISRGFISNATKEYIDLLSGEDLVGGTIDDYANAWEKLDQKVGSTSYSIHDFFTVNDDGDITSTGIDRFFKGLQQDFKGEVAKFNEKSGKWEYDFSQENLQKIQDEWGIGIEAIELLLEAAASAGYDIDWGGMFDDLDIDMSNFESVEAMISLAEKAQEEFNKLDGIEDVEFNFRTNNVEEATTEVEKARKAYLDLITNKDGSINLKAEGAEQMQFMLSTLLTQKQLLSTPAIMKVDTSQIDKAKTDVIDVINKAKELQTAYENYEIAITTGVDVESAKADLNSAIDGMKGTSVDVRAQLKLPTNEELTSAADGLGSIKVGASLDDTSVGAIATKIQTECTPEVIAKVTGLDESAIEGGSQQVVYTAEHSDVDNFINSLSDISKKIIYTYTTEGSKPNPSNIERSITYKYKTEGDIPEVNGTANANGSAQSGRAFTRGNWGIKGSGTALVGELGMETLVRGGHFYTIGDSGAEFIKYKQGDIIFNHKQTEELFKNGKVTSDGGRGRMYANGSAFANGGYPSNGEAFWGASASTSSFAARRLNNLSSSTKKASTAKTETKTSTKDNTVETTTKTTFGATATESNFSQKNTKTSEEKLNKDDFEETFDWIEIAIDGIERSIDKLDKRANNAYKSWSSRNQSLHDEIIYIGKEIDLQNAAYKEYMSEANAVGLSEEWAKKIRNGEINVDTVTDENLAEKIKDYQTWYNKAIACKDAIEDLKQTESELYAQRFENVQSQYDGILQGYEHTESMLNEYISQAEAKGHIISKKYYEALVKNEESNIAELRKEQADLIAQRDEAVNSGKIIKGSQAWYDMCADIDAVTQAIEEGATALIEYDNAMRDIDWQVFDLIQERISDVAAEADFLIDLMSNDKLFDDNGKLTDKGMATMGLHGQNYNTYMYAADDYSSQIVELDKQIAKDPYDQELINRRRELVELQRESILAAEDEKNAIRDLVEEGINLELEALQERIDLHNKELDSMKDLYDYQKKVKEQTEEVASLEKQMAAYANDDSEEAKSKIQELKVSLENAKADLEESEYDRYISDQSALLDSLYEEYELILNQRLDNVDALLAQVIDAINIASGAEGTIATALGSEGAIVKALGTNGTTIKTTLEAEAKNVGTTLSTAMKGIWSVDEGNAKSVITEYGKGFQDKQTTTNAVLGDIKAYINRMVDDVDKDATTKVNSNKTATSAKKDPTKNASTNTKTNTTTNKSTGDGTPKIGDKVKFLSGKYYYDSQGVTPAGSKNHGKQVYITNINKKKWATHPYHISTGKKLGSGDLGWLKLNQISGYATGKQNFLDNKIAWTQENGQEFIVRPSDGAILTPIAKGDSVLTSAASSNIWDMANSPAEFIKDNLNLGAANVPNNSTVQSNYTQHIDKVVFDMKNVKNYEELLSAMQRDKNFERLIMSMTIDQIAGKSSLGKGKSIR